MNRDFNRDFQAVVIGGGPAGLQAALLLARGRTRAVVYDSGTARHLVSAHSHSFLGADGMPPAELRHRGREQLEPYGTVDVRDAVIEGIEALAGGGFRVAVRDQPAVTTRFVILATGMRDIPLDIPGYRDFWGKTLLHCPYCHGWEFRDRPLGVLVTNDEMLGMAQTVTWWSEDVILFVAAGVSIPTETAERLAAANARIERRAVRQLLGTVDTGRLEAVELEDGTVVPRTALYYGPKQRQNALVEALASSLDLRLTPEGFVDVDEEMQTSVPGLYAAGDLTSGYQQIVEAARQGHRAALSIERLLKAGARNSY